jgi:hypothetical protein
VKSVEGRCFQSCFGERYAGQTRQPALPEDIEFAERDLLQLRAGEIGLRNITRPSGRVVPLDFTSTGCSEKRVFFERAPREKRGFAFRKYPDF